jgi:Uma2 family endonuclease
MGYTLEKTQRLRFEEYEALEAASLDSRYEYLDGWVYAMAGATTVHNQIVGNAAFALRMFYRPKGCRTYTENVKVEVDARKRYVYDVFVTCSERDQQSTQLVRDPVLILEVLSDSTEAIDLKEKVDAYLAIPGLQAYVIVAQKECWLRVYERDESGNWLPHRFLNALSDTLSLRSGWNIPLSELYLDVSFEG